MQEPTFLVLTALADGEKHGYALIEEISRISQGAVSMGVGTLYSALDRLTREGLITRTRDEKVAGRTRRFYRLTPHGAATLRDEIARLEVRTDAARQRLDQWRPVQQRATAGGEA